jgi:hypothetical protein
VANLRKVLHPPRGRDLSRALLSREAEDLPPLFSSLDFDIASLFTLEPLSSHLLILENQTISWARAVSVIHTLST